MRRGLVLLVVLVVACVTSFVSVGRAEIRGGGWWSSGGVAASGSSPGSLGSLRENPYHRDSLANPYGAGSPYKSDGLMNPYSRFGSEFSNQSWRNPYATEAPRLYEGGKYRGRLSTNPYDRDSTSNPYGRYGSPYSSESINNPFGAGNPYSTRPIRVYPGGNR